MRRRRREPAMPMRLAVFNEADWPPPADAADDPAADHYVDRDAFYRHLEDDRGDHELADAYREYDARRRWAHARVRWAEENAPDLALDFMIDGWCEARKLRNLRLERIRREREAADLSAVDD